MPATSGPNDPNRKPAWGWGGWGFQNNNNNNSSKVAHEPERKFGEIKITKAPQVPSTKLMAPPPKPIMAPEPHPISALIESSSKSPSTPSSTTLTAPTPKPMAALGSLLGASKAQSPPKGEKSTSTTSTTQQSQSSYFAPPKSSSTKSNASSRRRNQIVDKEEQFLLEMREKRKSPEKSGEDSSDPFAWYEDDLLERQADLSEDETYALELLDRRRKSGPDSLTPEEAEDLDLLIQDRQDAIKEEEELAELLDHKEHGEAYNEDRMYHLELLTKRRQKLGSLSEDEEADLKLLEEAWLDALADQDELDYLLDRKDDGEEVDDQRIYELELLERKRLGGGNFTKQETRDLEFLERKRLDVKLDLEEYQELLEMKGNGEQIDEDRFYILELFDRRRHKEELSTEELDDLAVYESTRNEAHLDRIEYKALLEAKDKGESIDNDRFHFLELLEKKRQGKELSDQEVEELEYMLWERDQATLDAEELAELLDKKLNGEDFDEDRLYVLDLVDRKREGEHLTDDELEELHIFEETRRNDRLDALELTMLLDRLDQGEKVDEDRLYELQLREKERLGDPLTPEEIEDLELFDKAKNSIITGARQPEGPRANGAEEASNDENWDNFSLGSQDLKDVKRLHQELEKEGVPRTIKFHDNDQSHNSRMSVASIGEDSYIQDLLSQRDSREEDRREETLEEALELYQVALREKKLQESEQLFMTIFKELLKENNEKAKESDRKQDELIEQELKLAELRKAQKHKRAEDAISSKDGEPAPEPPTVEAALIYSDQADVLPDESIVNAEAIAGPEAPENGKTPVESEIPRAEEHDIAEKATTVECKDGLSVQDRSQEARILDCDGGSEILHHHHKPEGDAQEITSNIAETDSREQQELDELNDLYDRQDRGEEIDEDRLFELELFDRHRQGEELNEEELEELAFFMKQRELYARFEVELRSLRTKQDNGEAVDEGRLRLLDIAQRKQAGEELSVDDLDDLEEFIVEEEEREEGIEVAAISEDKQGETQEPGVPRTEQRDLQATRKEGDEVSAVPEAPPTGVFEENASAQECDEVPVDAPKVTSTEEASPYDQSSEWAAPFASSFASAGAAVDADVLPLGEGVEGAVPTVAGGNDVVPDSQDWSAPFGSSLASADAPVDADELPLGDGVEGTMSIVADSSSAQRGGHQDFSVARATEQQELDELNDLYDRQDRGEEIDEDRLFELELFDRHRQGEELNEEELEELAFFMKQRELYARFEVELRSLRTKQDNGEAVDEGRLRLLDIAQRKQAGEELSVDDLDDLEEFIVEEEEREEGIEVAAISEDKQGETQEPGVPRTEQRDLQATRKEGDEVSAVPEAPPTGVFEENASAQECDEVPVDAPKVTSTEEASPYDQSSEWAAPFASSFASAGAAVDADVLPLGEGVEGAVPTVAGGNDVVPDSQDWSAPFGSSLASADAPVDADELPLGDGVEGTMSIVADSSSAQRGGHQDFSVARATEQQELDELNDLYDRQDRGEEIDEDRLFELELFDRHRQGEELNEEELEELAFFMKQRELYARFEVELRSLRTKQDNGEAVDEGRLRLLDIAQRKQAGEELSVDDLDDLEEFIVEEEEREEGIEVAAISEDKQGETQEPGVPRTEQRDLQATRKEGDEVSAVPEAPPTGVFEENASAQECDEVPVDAPKVTSTEEASPYDQSSEWAAPFASSFASAGAAVDADVLPLGEGVEGAVPTVAGGNDVVPDSQDWSAPFGSSLASADAPVDADELPLGDGVEGTMSIVADSSSAQRGGHQDFSVARATEQQELDELNDLYDRQDRGEEIDEDRLFELELFDRHRQGEELNEEELEELAFFMKQRELYARFEVELRSLRTKQDNGEAVDEGRLRLLDIAQRKQAGEELSVDDLDDLEEFIVEEEEREEGIEVAAISEDKQGETQEPGVPRTEQRDLQATRKEGDEVSAVPEAPPTGVFEENASAQECDEVPVDAPKVTSTEEASPYDQSSEWAAPFASSFASAGAAVDADVLPLGEGVEGAVPTVAGGNDVVPDSQDWSAPFGSSLASADAPVDADELPLGDGVEGTMPIVAGGDAGEQGSLTELDELFDLLDRHEAGQMIDEERLYELELRERQRKGEALTIQEKEDFKFVQQSHADDIRYKEELDSLLEQEASGHVVDQERLYFLDLLDRKRHGESLTDEETKDLDQMVAAEELKEIRIYEVNHEGHDDDEIAESVTALEDDSTQIHTPLEPLYNLVTCKAEAEGEPVADMTEEEEDAERQKEFEERQIQDAMKKAEEEAAKRQAESEAAKGFGWGTKILSFGGRKQSPDDKLSLSETQLKVMEKTVVVETQGAIESKIPVVDRNNFASKDIVSAPELPGEKGVGISIRGYENEPAHDTVTDPDVASAAGEADEGFDENSRAIPSQQPSKKTDDEEIEGGVRLAGSHIDSEDSHRNVELAGNFPDPREGAEEKDALLPPSLKQQDTVDQHGFSEQDSDGNLAEHQDIEVAKYTTTTETSLVDIPDQLDLQDVVGSKVDGPTESPDETEYEESLLEMFRDGKRLDKDQLFELRAFSKRRQGITLSQEDNAELDRCRKIRTQKNIEENTDRQILQQLRSSKAEGKEIDDDMLCELELFERAGEGSLLDDIEKVELKLFSRRRAGEIVADSEWEEIEIMKKRMVDDQLDSEELANLREQLSKGHQINEERLYELEQREKHREGRDLSDDEIYELELFDRIQHGEALTDAEFDELDKFRMDRLYNTLERELHQMREKESSGEFVDPRLLFELELFERKRSEDVLSDDELHVIQLLERKHLDESLSEDECEELEILLRRILPKKKDEVYMLDEEDREYRGALIHRREASEKLDGDEVFELEILNRADEGDQFFEAELSEFEVLRESRGERIRDKADLRLLRGKRDDGEEYDVDLLYELELFEKFRQREKLHADEKFELDMFEKRRNGEELFPDEVDELDMLRRQRELRALDEKDLADLFSRKERGEEVDEDFLYELLLFDRRRKGEKLHDDELFELDLFEKRREGLILTDDEAMDLERLKEIRTQIAKEAEEIEEIKARREDGELIDGDYLYELELFHRRRKKDALTNDELSEIALFEKRRAGEELSEAELDELALLKRARFERVDEIGPEEKVVENDDSAHIRKQRQRLQKGERLHRDELTELELLERQKRGEDLSHEEFEELEILRQERHKMESSEQFHTWDMDVDDEESSVSLEKVKKKRKKKKKKKKESESKPQTPLKEIKPKEKRMRRKKKPLSAPSVGDDINKKEPEIAKSPQNEMGDQNTAQTPPPVPVPIPIPPKREVVQKKGMFGGLFGKKSKKELELEEAKRRQEELIKEQLRAMQMEAELAAMEQEKEIQEVLIQEAIESKSKADVSISSWETDTSYEESDQESETEDQPLEPSSTDDDSSASGSSSVSGSSSSVSSGGEVVTDEDIQMNNSVGRKSIFTVESSEMWSETGLSAPTQDAGSKVSEKRIEEKTASASRASSMLTSSDGAEKVNSEERPAFALPPKQITTREKSLTIHEIDAVSVVSDDSFPETDGVFPKTLDVENLAQPPSAPQARSGSGRSARIRMSKSSTLSAHLRKQKREQKKREKRKQVTRHGDEISLGTVGLKGKTSEEKLAEHPPRSPRSPITPTFQQNNRDASKPARPWVDTIEGRKIRSQVVILARDEGETDKKDFFEDNQHMFDRSVFNFDQSAGQDGEAVRLSVVDEDESDTSVALKGADGVPDEGNEEQQLMDSIMSIGYEAEQSFTILGYGEIESKLAGKMKDKEEEFNEAWETIEADRAVAAQMNQRRMMRLRERGHGREEKKDEGPTDIPRLFLFEGEKVKKKKRRQKKKKERKKLKKLDNTLSKEFRKAMREVFESESEEEYDKTFGEREDEDERAPKTSKAKRRVSNESMYDSDNHDSDSNNVSDVSGGEASEEEFDDDYLKRLREKSMQQEVKNMLYENKNADTGSVASGDESQASGASRLMPIRADSTHSVHSAEPQRKSSSRLKRRRRPRKNRSGEIVGEGIDPADVYAQELEKKKVRKTFTVSDLRKEMEEMRQAPPVSSFDDAFGGMATSTTSFRNAKTPQTPMKSKKFKPAKSPGPKGPGVGSLRALNVDARPGLGRQTSFATHATGHSDQGLLGGGRKTFDTVRKAAFDIGGNLASVPTIEEDDEEAFLTGDSPKFGQQGMNDNIGSRTPGGGRRFAANLGSAVSSFAATLASPMGRAPRGVSSLGNDVGNMAPPHNGSADDDGTTSGAGLGGFGGTGFQEPLPVPEMQDDDTYNKKGAISKLAGKMKMSMKGFGFGKKKQASQDFGGMLDDDDDDGMAGGLLG